MAKKKMGRPVIEIDVEEFEKLCMIHCTLIEIAGWFRVSEDTIERFCAKQYGTTFAEISTIKRGIGKLGLRRTMYQKAQGGDNTMLIWLSKNYMGMKDKQEIEHAGPQGGPIRFQKMTKAELAIEAAKIAKELADEADEQNE